MLDKPNWIDPALCCSTWFGVVLMRPVGCLASSGAGRVVRRFAGRRPEQPPTDDIPKDHPDADQGDESERPQPNRKLDQGFTTNRPIIPPTIPLPRRRA